MHLTLRNRSDLFFFLGEFFLPASMTRSKESLYKSSKAKWCNKYTKDIACDLPAASVYSKQSLLGFTLKVQKPV